MPIYAAYGSNMHPEQMAERAPHSPMAGTGWLHGWRLTFGGGDIGWEGSLATVTEDRDDPDARVFIVLYDVTPEDEENLDRIFEAFQQLETADQRSVEGAGLGLAICRKLAIAHGGEITARSGSGCGTRFTVLMPATALATEAPELQHGNFRLEGCLAT